MPSLNFPADPDNGDIYESYIYDASKGVWKKQQDVIDTDNLPEGSVNLYFTDQRAIDATDGVYDPIGSADDKVSRSGDFMSGNLLLFAGPTDPAHATNKTYVDIEITNLKDFIQDIPDLIISEDPPTLGPDGDKPLIVGNVWYDISNGHLYVYYGIDSSNFVWVEIGGSNEIDDGVVSINNHQFPTDPDNGDTYNGYVYDASRNAWNIMSGGELELLADVDIDTLNADDILMYNNISFKWENVPGIRLDSEGKIPLPFLTLLYDELANNTPTLTIKDDAEWAADTSIPEVGSFNIALGTGVRLKIGNGVDTFANLEYIPTNAYISSQLSGKANTVSPTFTGDVVLPSTTNIGDVSPTELSYLNGVSSGIQSQINTLTNSVNTKAPSNNPTFTGTVSGVTKAMVGLSNVDNTSDANKPISTATQSALDGKLNLSGGTMTGKITLDADPTQALHAVTKQYVDSVEAGLIAKPQVKAATTENLTANYNNGTAGVGATLTSTTNGAFPLIDGVALTTANGDRGLLVKNQTNAAHNGRYNLTTQGNASTPWVLTRCGLCDEADEIPGAYIFVTDGTVNGQTGWVQHVNDPATFVVGTDAISVFQFSGAGTITAGTNISVNGYQVSVVNNPTFSGLVTLSSSGISFADGVQTKAGVPSISTFTQKTTSYTLDTLSLQDGIVEMDSTSPTTFTIPTDVALACPIGASMDIIQVNTGEVTIAGSSGVTVNSTPGLKLRTRWSSATILKRAANTWIVYGDLKA